MPISGAPASLCAYDGLNMQLWNMITLKKYYSYDYIIDETII
jgi:hypothetical protein